MARFPCLRLAIEAGRRGGTAPAVLVGADEQAVALFLRNRIRLPQIAQLIEDVLAAHTVADDPDLETVLAACAWAQEQVLARAEELAGGAPRIEDTAAPRAESV